VSESDFIFLSYRSTEADFALQFAADLKNAGVKLWMDRIELKPGDDWQHELQLALDACAAVIAVVSPEYMKSKYCMRELTRADMNGKPILPVLLRTIPRTEWPLELQRHQYIDFTGWFDQYVYRQQFYELIKVIERHAPTQLVDIPDAEERYLTSLIAKLEARKGVLDYVDLSLMAEEPDIRPQPRVTQEWGLDRAFALLEETATRAEPPSEPRKTPLEGIRQAVERYPRFVLIGEPGAGKTTTIQRLALDAARARQADAKSSPLPVLLSLPGWADGLSPDDFIGYNWQLDINPTELLSREDVLLYLDGLDEMGASGPDKSRILREWLHNGNAPERVIITCRAADYLGDLDLQLPTVLAEQMDEARIRQFARNYLGKDDSKPFLSRILTEDREDPENMRRLFRLARNPFMLTVLMVVYKNSPQGQLPRNPGALFKRLVMALWERERIRQTPGWVKFEDMESAFARLALAMIDEGTPIDVPTSFALTHVDGSLLQAGVSAVLLETRANQIRFHHQLMLEYFAAAGLAGLDLTDRLEAPRFDHWGKRVAGKWDQVVIALCGIVPDADPIVRKIKSVNPYLALDCIASGISISETMHNETVGRLLEILGDVRSDGRVAAVDSLGAIGDPKAWPVLLEALRDKNWYVRVAAKESLRRASVPTVPGLVEALREWDWDVREAAARALKQIGDSAVPGLLDALRHQEWSVRRGAAEALREIGDPAAVPGLVDSLRDDDSLVRRASAEALGWIRDTAAVNGLLKVLRDEDWRVRRAAARALWQIGAPAVPGLIEAVRDASVDVRSSAAEALGAIGDASAVAGLVEALQDVDALVRRSAAEALGWIRDPAAVPGLIERLDDIDKPRWEEERVCDMAAQSLERIGTPEALTAVKKWRRTQVVSADEGKPTIPPPIEEPQDKLRAAETLSELKKALHDADWFVRRGAAEALGATRDAKAVPGLLIALKDDDSDVRWVAARALGAIADASAVPALVEALHDRDFLVTEAAAWALWQIGAPAVPGLIERLRDPSVDVRGGAVEALSAIGDAAAVPGLIERLSDTEIPWLADERICDIAAGALRRIGTKEALAAVESWGTGHLAPEVYQDYKQDAPLAVNTPVASRSDMATIEEVEEQAQAEVNQVQSIPELLDKLRSDDWALRKSALKLLKDLGDRSALPGLLEMLGDDRGFVRVAAAEALVGIADSSAIPALMIALNDDKTYMRVAAADALACIKDPAAVPGLLDALHDKDRMIGVAAAEALGRIGSDMAVPGLLDSLRHEDSDVRRASAEALGIIKDPAALPSLLEALHDPIGYVRRAAAEALGTIGDDAAVPGLVARLEDTGQQWWEEERVCDIAAEALQRIGSGTALAAVEDWKRAQN
jgi:HEAT repeat protein